MLFFVTFVATYTLADAMIWEEYQIRSYNLFSFLGVDQGRASIFVVLGWIYCFVLYMCMCIYVSSICSDLYIYIYMLVCAHICLSRWGRVVIQGWFHSFKTQFQNDEVGGRLGWSLTVRFFGSHDDYLLYVQLYGRLGFRWIC